jgi:ribosome assembly protein 1
MVPEAGETDDVFGAFSGQTISSVKDLCKRALLNAQPRIVEGVYKCSLTATPENYGIVYGLINKNRGVVISEEVQEGTNYFLLDVKVPLVESFEFGGSLRKQCKGITYP